MWRDHLRYRRNKMAGIGFGTNYDVKLGNGLGANTQIVKFAKTDITQAELDSAAQELMLTHTIAGVGTADGSAFATGTTDVVYFAVQGPVLAADASNALGVTGAATTIEATFNAAK